MTRVGMVGLSTSHPGIFAPLLAGLGMGVHAVLDADDERVRVFRDAHPGVVVAADLDELARTCDVVMVLDANWDDRLARVRALVVRDVPVFVDKPVAGTAGELRELADLAGRARIDGGSALRVAPEAVALRAAAPKDVEVSCYGHPFYYGVHAVALAVAVLGPGLVSARAVAGEGDRSIEGVVRHVGGAEIRVAVSTVDTPGAFRATVDRTRLAPAAELFYPALLRDTMTRLADPAAPTRPGRDLVECELALLALARSRETGGPEVDLDAVPAEFRPWPARTSAR